MNRMLTFTSLGVLLAGCASTPDANRDRAGAPLADADVPGAGDAVVPQAGIRYSLAARGLPEEGMWKCDPAFADVNGDGHLDLGGIPRLGYGPRVWLGDGMGNWTLSSDGLQPEKRSCGGGVCFADVDGDGHLDLAVADHCNGVYVYLGDGTGSWREVTSELNPTDVVPDDKAISMFVGSEDVDVADIDGDGDLDLLVAGSDEGGLHVYLGDGTGRNWRRQNNVLPTEGWANRVQLHDMNGDRRPDIVTSWSEGPRVWLNDGQGDWIDGSEGLPSPMMHGLFHGLDVADFDRNGRPDIVICNWVDGPEVYMQQADGSWNKLPDVFPQMMGGAVGVAAGDVDHDGHPDIVTSGRLEVEGGYVRGAFVLLGDGRGNFRYVESGLPSTGLSAVAGVALGDVDDDGWLDVAVASGMNVESAAGPTQPIVPQRMLLYRSRPTRDDPRSLASHPDE